ncbi:MAG: phosphatase PAP2 family protein [Thermoanaerobaculia bacterium]
MTARQEPFLAWPGDELRRTLPLCIAFAGLFVLCYGGAAWLTGLRGELPAWDLPFERAIPFVPSLSLVYLTITPALMLAPFVFRTRSQLAPLVGALSIEVLVATCFFLLVPQTTAYARPPVTGWALVPFTIADTLNLQHNEFPSLHVALACSAAWAYSSRMRWLGKLGWGVWSLAVAASTLLLREHHLADILGGVVLAVVVMKLAYPWLQRPETKQAIWVELCCLWQCAQFSRRHVRYFVIFLAIYLPSIRNWRRYRVVRTAFCAAQWIDDLLDGDRPSEREPLDIVDELVGEMSRASFSPRPLSRLTGTLFEELRAFRTETDDPERAFIELVREMQRDRRRVIGRELWNDHELDDHNRRTFHLSVDLMLVVSGCEARARDVPSLIDALGWCSVFRDLEDDLAKGLVNVPRRICERVADRGGPITPGLLATTPEFRAWVRDAHLRASADLEEAAGAIVGLRDPRSRRILSIFQSSVTRFAQRLPRSYPECFPPRGEEVYT